MKKKTKKVLSFKVFKEDETEVKKSVRNLLKQKGYKLYEKESSKKGSKKAGGKKD